MRLKQLFSEIYGCGDILQDQQALLDLAAKAAKAVGATVIGEHAVHYEPFGLTLTVFLAESHILFTTWPEHDLLLVDILLCNPAQDVAIALAEIVRQIEPKGEVVTHEIVRVIAPSPVTD